MSVLLHGCKTWKTTQEIINKLQIYLHGSTTQKTALNIILAAVRT
jgi:hypothetical protein